MKKKTAALECHTNSYPSIIHMQSKLCFVQLARSVLMYVHEVGLFGCMLLDTTSNTSMHIYGFTITVSQLKQLLSKMRFDKNAEQKSMQ